MTFSDNIMKPIQYRNVLLKEQSNGLIDVFNSEKYSNRVVYRQKKEYSFKELLLVGDPKLEQLQMMLIQKADWFVKLWRTANKVYTFPKEYGFEAVRIKRYDAKDGDSFPLHADVMDYASAKRFLICMFYLNDDFTGGETVFGSETKINYTIIPEKGKIVIFTPFWDNPHAGLPLIEGTKYIANVYFHFL